MKRPDRSARCFRGIAAVAILPIVSTLCTGCLTLLANRREYRGSGPPTIGFFTSIAAEKLAPQGRILTVWSARAASADASSFAWTATLMEHRDGRDVGYGKHGPVETKLAELPPGCSQVRLVLAPADHSEALTSEFRPMGPIFALSEGEWRDWIAQRRARPSDQVCDVALVAVYAGPDRYAIRAASLASDFYRDIPVEVEQVPQSVPFWGYPVFLLTIPLDVALIPVTELLGWIAILTV